jgi:hypothetical protein
MSYDILPQPFATERNCEGMTQKSRLLLSSINMKVLTDKELLFQ